ncbi:MAG TPA: glycosyltransferase family 2 protein [Herpetosiphonaceae bacterium]
MRKALFWGSLGLIIYNYLGFPLLMLARGLVWRRAVKRADITPRVTLVIAVYNGEQWIGKRLDNALSLDYPRDQLEIIVGSDGSTDRTNEIIAGYVERGVQFLALPRQGKIPTLNAAVARATGEILLFSDATSIFAPDALRFLVRSFADPSVGAVGGHQVYVSGVKSGSANIAERLYWRFDQTLKTLQSQSGSMIASAGSLYALRSELFEPIPVGVLDDHFVSTLAIAKGYRLVLEPDAIVYQTIASSDHAEFRRKVRVIAQGLWTMWIQRPLFNPLRYGFYSIQLFSHKLLRWSIVWPLLLLLGVSPTLYRAGRFYRLITLGQLGFYGSALAALALRQTPLAGLRPFKLLSIPYYFCMVNLAELRAWLMVVSGKRIAMWDRTERDASQEPYAVQDADIAPPASASDAAGSGTISDQDHAANGHLSAVASGSHMDRSQSHTRLQHR